MPADPEEEPLPVIIDIRGIRWDYPNRDLSDGPYPARMMDTLQDGFVFVVPCLRGHAFKIGETLFESEGDRRDSWDGATDDTIALLSLVEAHVPEADVERVASFGSSRGAAVALLHGIRDRRVDAVVGFAAPADWFALMARPGERWRDALESALADPRLSVQTREHQFIEWFLADRDHLPMSQVRARILASSPLYFVEELPPTQLDHGAVDRPVPVANALAIEQRWKELGRIAPDFQCLVYEDTGHSLQTTRAHEHARRFLESRLLH